MVSFRNYVSKTMVLNVIPENTQRQVSLHRNELVILEQDALQTHQLRDLSALQHCCVS